MCNGGKASFPVHFPLKLESRMEVVVLDATRVGRRGLIDRKWRTRTQNVAYLQISSLSNYASIVKRAPNKVIAFDWYWRYEN